MKTVKFINIKLTNFKMYEGEHIFDLSHSKISFEGSSGTGKTTILDAITWLFLGQNYVGNKTDVDFVTNGIENTEAAIVELKLDMDGTEYIFEKRYRKETLKKSHSNYECLINGHFFGLNKFNEKIGDLIAPLDVIKYLITPYTFINQEKKEKKESLMEMCGNIHIDDLIEKRPEFEKIKAELNLTNNANSVLVSLRKSATYSKKEMNEDRERLQVIEEDLKASEQKRKGLKIDQLLHRKTFLKEILNNAKNENQKILDHQNLISSTRNTISTEVDEIEQMKQAHSFFIKTNKKGLQDLLDKKQEYQDNSKKELTNLKRICKSCNQEIPQEERMKAYKKTEFQFERLILECDIQISELQSSLEWKENNPLIKTKLFAKKVNDLESKRLYLNTIIEESDSLEEEINLVSILEEIEEIDSQLKYDDLVDIKVTERDNILVKIEKQKKKISDQEERIRLIIEYQRLKLEMTSEIVNLHSKKVEITIFDINKEGEIYDKFNIYLIKENGDKVKERNICGGESIVLGSEILKILESYYGIKMPLLVDKKESSTYDLRNDTQIIQTIVKDSSFTIVPDTEVLG